MEIFLSEFSAREMDFPRGEFSVGGKFSEGIFLDKFYKRVWDDSLTWFQEFLEIKKKFN